MQETFDTGLYDDDDERIPWAQGSVIAWAKKLNCQEKDLIFAMINVGNRVKVINDFLILNRLKKDEF